MQPAQDRSAESESIQNQKSLLCQYAGEMGWEVCGIYSDEDYSGADGDRPAFRRLIRGAESGCFDIVLCKTQSRFTRDMELVEKYLHNLFPQWGVRFIALLDHADTDIKGNKKARQINGLVNEWYLEDLSENIRAVLDNKRKNGKFIGSFPAYGYSKDPNDRGHLIVDGEAADVVKKIFMLAAAGLGRQNIADRLNALCIPNPTKYKELKGYSYVNGGAGGHSGLWNRSTVGRILGNETYTGMLVQGRRRKASYKNHKIFDLPREEWIRVAGTHEAIVDMDLFLSVQSIPDGRKRTFQAVNSYKLAGKVRCMECGALMKKISSVYKGARREYLKCGGCERQTIRYDLLEGLVQEKLAEYYYRYCGGRLSVLPDAARLLISSIEVSKKDSPSHEQEVYINWLF